MFIFFFFQAEDGIRDKLVTGVQTCALPIFRRRLPPDGQHGVRRRGDRRGSVPCVSLQRERGRDALLGLRQLVLPRQIGRASVGKECRSRWSPYHLKKKKKKTTENSQR